MESAQLQTVEFGRLSLRDWAHLVGGEPDAFGATNASFEFRPKDHHVGVRDLDGKLVAAGGSTLAAVRVEGHGRFEVVGQGALIVRRDLRSLGVSWSVIDRMMTHADESGLDRAMIFCEPRLRRLYERLGFVPVPDPVWVDQPGGPVRWPALTMWRPITPGTIWPPGVVHVEGLPF